MKRLFQVVKSSARVGYAALAWALAGLVVVQVFYAGHAVLVNPGDWAAHRTLGHLFSPPIFAMFVFALLGRMPGRFVLYSVALFVLYSLQYLFLFLPGTGLAFMRAFHPVNALVLLLGSMHTARGSWQLVNAGSIGRLLLTGAVTAVVLVGSVIIVNRVGVNAGPDGALTVTSLANAEESFVPAHYKMLTNPIAAGDDAAVAAGRDIAMRQCAVCHGANLTGTRSGAGASDLTQSAAMRSEQFLMWAVSEGSARGMPAWKSQLSQQERWYVVAFIKSLVGHGPVE